MTYEEFAAKRKLLQMKYDGNLTLAENLQNLDDSLTGTKDVALANFINAAVKQAIGLEESIYEFMGGNTKAARDVVLGKCGVIGIGGKHDDILGKNGLKDPYGPHAKHPPMQLVLAGEMLRNELGLSSGLRSGLRNKPLYRLDKNNTCKYCMHNNLGMCNLGPIKGDKPIPVVVLRIANRNFYKERCNSYRTWN